MSSFGMSVLSSVASTERVEIATRREDHGVFRSAIDRRRSSRLNGLRPVNVIVMSQSALPSVVSTPREDAFVGKSNESRRVVRFDRIDVVWKIGQGRREYQACLESRRVDTNRRSTFGQSDDERTSSSILRHDDETLDFDTRQGIDG